MDLQGIDFERIVVTVVLHNSGHQIHGWVKSRYIFLVLKCTFNNCYFHFSQTNRKSICPTLLHDIIEWIKFLKQNLNANFASLHIVYFSRSACKLMLFSIAIKGNNNFFQ